MKKVLALILTAAMLLSCMIVGTSAVREHATNVAVSTDKAATNEANFVGFENSFYADNYTFSITMKSSTADFGDMAENVGFLEGTPLINMKAGTIGWTSHSATVSYTFADDTWYTIQYTVADGKTVVSVNGEVIGTVNETIRAMLYGSFYRSYVTEIYFKSGDNYALYEDFEDGVDNVFSTEVTTFEETSVSYENYNVTYSAFGAATNEANFCGLRYNDPYAKDNYTATFVIKSCTADFGDMADNVGFCDGVPIINMVKGTIGWNNGPSVAYTFADDTWYTIEYVVDGNTTIKVNGETVGTLDGAMPGNLYGSFYRSYVADVKYVGADGNVYLDANFDDGEDEIFSTDVTNFTAVGNKYDLGMKYWMFNEGNNYAPINVGKQGSNFDIEMDICLDAANSEFGTAWNDGLARTPRISTTYVGVGSKTIDYTFVPGTWYHIKWDADNGSTAIYVDDKYVGTVADAATLYDGNQAFWQWIILSIDNLRVGTYFNDMENGLGDYQGLSMEYDFDKVDEDTIFDHLAATEVGGDAYLIENNWDSTSGGYIELGDRFANLGSNYIINFDLALLPTNDSADGNYFEIWTDWANGATPKRWKVGTAFAGKDEDLYQLDWGEATKDNFHQVTLQFANNRGTLYVDQVEVCNAIAGNYASLGNMLCMNWNTNAIIDNFVIVDGVSYETIVGQDRLPTGSGYGRGNNVIKWVDLDAEDYCAANGCMTGKTVMDYDSTCYSLGQYTTSCAVCGDVHATHEIALKDHKWADYDINRTTSSGLVYTYCRNSGCVEQRYTTLPTKYEGKLYQFYDMQDDFVLVVGDDSMTGVSGLDYFNADGEQCWKVTEDGRLEFLGHAVYDEFHGLDNSRIPVNDWSVSFDFTVDSAKHWVNEDGGVDHESFFLRCAGNAGYQLCAGWDRIDNKLFIRKFDNSKTFCTVDYTFEDGVEYNFMVTCRYEGYGYTHEDPDFNAPWYAEIAIWINGEKVLAYGDTEGYDAYSIYDIAYGSDFGAYLKFPALSQFGTSYTIDNLAFGSADFRIITVLGDVDNDGELTASDALMMRMYLAGVITSDDFINAKLADMNADGAINAKDQLLIRKALVA